MEAMRKWLTTVALCVLALALHINAETMGLTEAGVAHIGPVAAGWGAVTTTITLDYSVSDSVGNTVDFGYQPETQAESSMAVGLLLLACPGGNEHDGGATAEQHQQAETEMAKEGKDESDGGGGDDTGGDSSGGDDGGGSGGDSSGD